MPDTQQQQHAQHALPPSAKPQKLLPATTGEPPKGKGSLLRKLGLLLILLLAAGITFFVLNRNKKEEAATEQKAVAAANRPVPVTVSAVAARTMPIYFTALGTVTAYNTVTVKSRVDGQLLSVNVREGQQVTQGQVIAMIDPRPYQAVVAQAEGALLKDEAAAANAKAEAGRYTALYEAGVVSKESEQVQVSTAGQSVGTLAADRAAIQAAKVNVAYTRITSPINGVVGLRQVDAGNIVHASDANGLIVVTQLQPIAVVFTLPEDQLPQVLKLVRAGQKLVVEALDRSESKHLASGTLLTVDNQIDTTTGTVKVKAVFQNADGALFPNQFVNVRLILEQRANSLVIPASALQTGTTGNFVYVARQGDPPHDTEDDGATGPKAKVTGGKGSQADAGKPAADAQAPQQKGPKYYVDVQNVAVDLTEGSSVILKGGVNPGDLVVIDGQEKLKKYSRITPQMGRSNAGGPGTQQIGSDASTASQQPSSPDQPTPDPKSSGKRATGIKSTSSSANGGGRP